MKVLLPQHNLELQGRKDKIGSKGNGRFIS
jgi:hypothetical protein